MTKAKFFQMAEQAGIEVEYTAAHKDKWTGAQYGFHCMCDAPRRQLFSGTGLHCDGSIQGQEGTKGTDWKDACKMLQELIADGFDDCTDPDCEVCTESE